MAKKRGRPRLDELRDDRSNYLDKEFESEKRSQVYNTKRIEEILDDISLGKKADMMPFFHGKTEWRNSDIIFEYTKEEWEEIQLCTDNPIYFIEKYCYFLTDYGRKIVKLRDYQKDVVHLICDETYNEALDLVVPKNRRVIMLQSRQTGKTTTTAAAFCWYLCFHFDKNAMVLADKEDTAKDILSKIKDVFHNLPFFLKPGVLSVSEESVRFENGCSLRCVATGKAPAVGNTLHLLMIDECALIPANAIDNFWRSVFPTMSSSELSQIVVMSTPRGKHNLYYDLYSKAVTGENGFVYKRVDYWEVPGHDTEEWKQEQISAFGETLFNQEFGLSFEEDASKLIAPGDLKFFNKIKTEFQPVEIYGIPWSIASKIYWHPDFHPDQLTFEDLINNLYLLQIDTAQGKQAGSKGQEDPDWNVISIYRIELMSPGRILKNRLGYKEVKIKDCVRFRQIGIYLDQDTGVDMSADAAKNIVFNLFRCGQAIQEDEEIDNCRIMIETNFEGSNWIKKFMTHDMFYSSLIVKTLHSQKAVRPEFGFKTVSGSRGKGYWCEEGAKLIANRQIIVSQDYKSVPNMSSIQQLEAFGKNKRGIYEGSCMHDDIAVTILFLSICLDQEEFIHWIEDWYERIRYMNISDNMKNKIKRIDKFLDNYDHQVLDDQYEENEVMDLYTASTSGFNQVQQTTNTSAYTTGYGNMGNTYGNLYRQQQPMRPNIMNPYRSNNPFGIR